MAERSPQFTVTIPAGTPRATPVTIALPLDNAEVESIDLEVPPGPSGLMGFYLANNGVPWIPRATGQFIVWDDNSQSYYATDYPNASGWQIVGYNTGLYPHVVIVRFHVNSPPGPPVDNTPPTVTFAPVMPVPGRTFVL